MLTLHAVPAEGQPFERPVGTGPVVIGRSSDADLVLADRFVSRHHARLFWDGEALLVEDLGSRNGTLVNGRVIGEPTRLRPGDVVGVSGSVITVVDPEASAAPPAPQSGTGRPLPAATILRPVSELISASSTGLPAAESRDEGALRRYAERLQLVNEVHQALARPLASGELLDLFLDRVFAHLRPETGAIFLRGADGEMRPAAVRAPPDLAADHPFSQTLVHEVAERAQAALVLDALTDDRFATAESILDAGVRSLVAAPLLDAAGTLGMIVLTSRLHVRRFSETDMELLASLASAAALRVRNLGLAEEAAERRRLEEELALARRIQVALLPERLPEVAGYEIHAGNVPSRGVSGDYYEVFPRLDGRECVLMVADVSGKGIAASLLTASLAALSASPLEDGLPPAEVCNRLSRLLYQRTPPEKFATAFLAILEPATGAVRYANAGHNPGLLVRAGGGLERLAATGPPLAILPAATYDEVRCELLPGDAVVLYTDGITEARDPGGEEYGLERLAEVCRRHRGEPLGELARRLEADLAAFAAGVPYADDRTLVIVRRA